MRGRDERGGRGKIRTLDHPVNNPPEPAGPAQFGRFFTSLERHVKHFDFNGDGAKMDTGIAGSSFDRAGVEQINKMIERQEGPYGSDGED